MLKNTAKRLPIKIHIYMQKIISILLAFGLNSDRLEVGFSIYERHFPLYFSMAFVYAQIVPS